MQFTTTSCIYLFIFSYFLCIFYLIPDYFDIFHLKPLLMTLIYDLNPLPSIYNMGFIKLYYNLRWDKTNLHSKYS